MRLNPQKFSTEEFQEQASWIGKLFSSLNSFIGEVVTGFSNGLTVQDNLYQEIKEISWVNTSTDFPLKFRTKFAIHPRGLFPIYLLDKTTGAYSPLAPWISWSYSDGQVIIDSISGLDPHNYTIRVLVIYG